MRARRSRFEEAHEEISKMFTAELGQQTHEGETRHGARIIAIGAQTADVISATEAKGSQRVEQARHALARVEELVTQANEEAADELAVCKTHASAEEVSRLTLLEDVFSRRLDRLCTWIAEREEDGRLLEEVALQEEAAAQTVADAMADELGAISLVEAKSRDIFDRARIEHIGNVDALHKQYTPLFLARQKEYEDEMMRLQEERRSVSLAAVQEHTTTVQAHMAEVLAVASRLRE